jgi:glycosyltransferase involved in cell wall biosynthesis
MRMAIVHYHLRKGGVTRVIASSLEALGQRGIEAVVLSSTEPGESIPCPYVVVPELAYTTKASVESADRLHGAMLEGARSILGQDPDLWHIHNHCLGKNVNFPPVLKRLLNDGHRALLHIHDFAEDGRPGNYTGQQSPFIKGVFEDYDTSLYPVAPQVGYAVLNGRDRTVLQKAGVPTEQIHWLPNAVSVPSTDSIDDRGSPGIPLVLYPTRAIRRKNLGELLLLSIACPEARFATTLAPKNPLWFSIYNKWTNLAAELRLNIEFGMGEAPGTNFGELVASASAMVTTSVGEGFGLAFLEPWLFGKPLCGRNLPELTGDFRNNGISLPDLYDGLPVSLALFDLASQKSRFMASLESAYRAFGRSISGDELETAWQTRIDDEMIDFGSLDETAQAEVIRELAGNRGCINSPYPGGIDQLDSDVVATNVDRIRSTYGLGNYGEKLEHIYHSILDVTPEPVKGLPSGHVLDGFLDPERFKLLLG